jgi:ornithine cyclodeaminase
MSASLRVIDADTIRRLAPPRDLIGWMREAMLAVSAGRTVMPLRRAMELPEGRGMLGIMPGHVADAASAGVKLVSLVPPERRRGSSHLGLMVLYDVEGLVPVAILCGATITALRTAAATAVATDALARPDARRLTILGAGEQAEAHLEALACVRPFAEVRVWSRSGADAFVSRVAGRFDGQIASAPSVEAAVEGADVICTVTASKTSILPGALAPAGCHVNLVGASHASAQETDDDLVAASRFFVDYRASALDQAGELLGAISRGVVGEDWIAGEIGEVLAGRVAGRERADQLTVYKSVGVAAQDVVAARRILDRALAEGLGQVVAL